MNGMNEIKHRKYKAVSRGGSAALGLTIPKEVEDEMGLTNQSHFIVKYNKDCIVYELIKEVR